MSIRFQRLITTGLAAATLLGVAPTAFAQQGTRTDRSGDRRPIVIEAGPREAPPPSREDRHEARRAGYVWVTGRWDWQRRDRRWEWIPGRWEAERTGKQWRDARWDRRGDEWVLVDGDWIDGSASVSYPTSAPPALRDERPQPRRGYIWVRGKWGWQNGNWQWTNGRYEQERAAQRWNEGRWDRRGDRWEWVEGGWAEIPKYPPLDQPPPPPQRDDDVRPEPGWVVIPGHWAWTDGAYVWRKAYRARANPGKHYQPGEWVQRNGQWMWTNGDWVAGEMRSPPFNPGPRGDRPRGPSGPPPAPRHERIGRRDGYVWARGFYTWNGRDYEWTAGHWEPSRERATWNDGRWEQSGNEWIWVEGGWR